MHGKWGKGGVARFLLIAFGLAAFLLIIGPKAFIPTNIAWLSSGDPAQHYLGWAFYRFSPWTNPIGLNPDYGMDISSSIVYSDSIPLMAILLKPFSAWLPETFQYLGFWALLCFVLQGYFAYLLIGRITKEPLLKILGAGFFIFAPAFLWRLGVHASLASQFVLLAALYLNLVDLKTLSKTKILLAWLLVIGVTALTHFYLLSMVCVLWFASYLNQIYQTRSIHHGSSLAIQKNLLQPVLVVLLLLLLFYQAGYFVVTSLSTGNYGIGRINLLSIIDPDTWSYVLPNLKDVPDPFEPNARIFESFVYLGLGVIIAGLFTLYAVLKKRVAFKPLAKRYVYLVIALIGLALFAISNNVALGPWGFSIPMSEGLRNSASILRASARLFWPVYYVLILMIIYGVIRGYSKKQAILILSICLVIQVADSSAGWLPKRKNLFMLPASSTMGTPLQSPFWEQAAKHYQNVVVILPQDGGSIDWKVFADYAARYHLKTNSAYLGRYDTQKLLDHKKALLSTVAQGGYDANALYILADNKVIPALAHLNSRGDLFTRIDNFNVLAPKWGACQACAPISQFQSIDLLVPSYSAVSMSKPIVFSRSGEKLFPFVLLSGWDYPQDWGVWAVGQRAELTLPLPVANTAPHELVFDLRALVNAQQATQQLGIGINGQAPLQFTLSKSDHNRIAIPLTAKVIAEGYVQIVFDLPTAKRPKDIGIGDDERLLSIGLIDAQFH
jgi:hypothetical protein